jgi:hypothetical protein
MQRLKALPSQDLGRLRGLLFDLDDTLLDHGRLLPATYESVCNLAETGLILVGCTGRPASFGQVLVRQWPIAGMVTENGLVSLSRRGNGVELHDPRSAQRPALQRELQRIASAVRERFQLTPTDDSLGRVADTTFDLAETCNVPDETVTAAISYAHSLGARTIRSSVHLHLFLEAADKASGAIHFLQHRLGVDPSEAVWQYAFIGDSENDAACFAGFKVSVGVRNLRGRFSLTPRYRTDAERGAGFSELARLLMAR